MKSNTAKLKESIGRIQFAANEHIDGMYARIAERVVPKVKRDIGMELTEITPYLSQPVKAVWEKLPMPTRVAVKNASDEMSGLMLRAAKHGPSSLNNEERVYLEAAASNLAAIGLNRKNALALLHEVAQAILKHAVNITW